MNRRPAARPGPREGMATRIGIMGGTFDPIHYGHLVTAEEARHDFQLDQVLFVPSGQPPHKTDRSITLSKHRYLMTVLATLTNPHFAVSRVDIDRPGPSYTIDTIELVRQQYGPDEEYFFISGADAILELLTWKEPERLLGLCEFIAATRPGFPLTELAETVGELGEQYGARVHVLTVPALAISSTDVRQRVASGRPIRYLVPETVLYYIEKNRLYRPGSPSSPEGEAPAAAPSVARGDAL